MNLRIKTAGLIAIILLVLLAGCNLPGSDSPTSDSKDIQPTATDTQAGQQPEEATATITATPAAGEETATATTTATPTGTEAACTDQIEFIDDVTIPDDSSFAPDATFTKTWRLKNSGTCTWTTDYSLAFVSGEQMGGTSPQPFTSSVAPGQTVDVSVDLTAPDSGGTYRGDWKLRNDKGQDFGSGDNAQYTFYVQIVVTESVSSLNLGASDWSDTFNSSANWYMLDTANTKFSVSGGDLIMKVVTAGGDDEWALSLRPAIEDFYLQITVRTGAACSGLDRYGVIVRAPDPSQGYVFGFSCDGRFRLYRWDGAYNALQNWTASPNINAGPNQTNELGILADGDTIKLYANGTALGTYTDATFSEGRFGLYVGSKNTNNLQIYVEEAAYWLLND